MMAVKKNDGREKSFFSSFFLRQGGTGACFFFCFLSNANDDDVFFFWTRWVGKGVTGYGSWVVVVVVVLTGRGHRASLMEVF